jgi:DNA-binding IclR family transcriptional regulator
MMRTMSVAAKRSTGVGVLDRCMAVLGALESGARSFTQIAEATGLTRPTAHRLVKALQAHGLLAPLETAGYRLGPRLLDLASAARRDLPLREVAHPVLQRLARTTGESAQLFVREQDRRICVDSVQSENELRTIVQVGATLPLSAGSAGKVLLAFGPEPLQTKAIQDGTKLTARTPVGPALARQLAAIRRLGYATSAGEREPGVGSVSAPVRDRQGQVVAVVSVSGPESRLGKPGRYSASVLEAATQIGKALGADPN